MMEWRPQHYRRIGLKLGVSGAVLQNAVATGESIARVDPKLPPLFTLRHIAHVADVDYQTLRAAVARAEPSPYRVFRIRKRPAATAEKRFRVICVPNPSLRIVQKWLTANIFSLGRVHHASTAYSRGSTLVDAARPHCGCRWLIKLDVKNFFESISELDVYRAIRALGYQPLVAFELARICTRLGSDTKPSRTSRWLSLKAGRYKAIPSYVTFRMGHLPQGAPTSPMLSNLAVCRFDEALTQMADRYGLTYTRYADDIVLSTASMDFHRGQASKAIGEVYSIMGKHGFSPNCTKTRVVAPGARKVVLGLLVDGEEPRLSRAFKGKLRMHHYYLTHPEIGPAKHAQRRGFAAVAGLRNHLQGLLSFARQVEPEYGRRVAEQFRLIPWP